MSAKTEAWAEHDAEPVAFTWVDSEVAAMHAAAGTIEIRLSAARLSGAPERYMPGVLLRLQGQLRAGNPQDALGRVVAASLIIQGRAIHQLPVPSQTPAAFKLSLQLGHGTALEVEGDRLDVQLPQHPRIIEGLSC